MHFGENQLSPSSIGFSPLPAGHPPGLQPWWVRASTQSYLSFTLPMRRSPRFGSAACDSTALFRLAFATAPPHGLTSPRTSTRRLILQKARGHITTTPKGRCQAPTACRHTVSGTISQPLTGALFTFPSRYSSTIGHQGVFRLTRWSWQIRTGFLGPRATREHPQAVGKISPTRLSRSTAAHSRAFGYPTDFSLPAAPAETAKERPTTPVTQRLPALTRHRFSLFPFRSPLLRESLLLSLPAGTEMFHFPAFPPTVLCVQTAATRHNSGQVPPFGNPRINAW